MFSLNFFFVHLSNALKLVLDIMFAQHIFKFLKVRFFVDR